MSLTESVDRVDRSSDDSSGRSSPSSASITPRTLGAELLAARAQLAASDDPVGEIFGMLTRLLRLAESPSPAEEFLTPEKLGEFLGVSRVTVYALNDRGTIPAPLPLGGPKYWRTEILAWCAAGCPARNVWAKKRETWLKATFRA